MITRGLRRLASRGWQLGLLGLGTFLYALAMRAIIEPNGFLTGGVAGLCLLLHSLFGLPVGFMNLLFNIPIFFLGFRSVGRRFGVYSGLTVVLFWGMADHIPLEPLTHDPLLGAIFSGILIGMGSALALRAGGSLGGFDILGVVVNRRFSLGIGEFSLFLNAALTLTAGVLESPERAMYTLVSMYVTSHTLDALQSPKPQKAVLVFSQQARAIKQRVLTELGRGASLIKAEGAYSGAPMDAVLCVMTRFELKEMRDIVEEEDSDAFVTVLDASDVMGHFKRPTAFAIWLRQQGGGPPEASGLLGVLARQAAGGSLEGADQGEAGAGSGDPGSA